MKKRVLSLFLAFVLSFSMMPMSAFAEEAGTVTEQETQNSENTADVSTTGEETTGEETVEVSTTGEDISGGNAVTKYAAVEAAQALINALPEEVTAENADALQAQLIAIDKAMEALNDEQRAELDMTRLENICAALNGLVAVQDTHDHGTMTPWTDADSLPDDGKSYYLDIDVTLHSTWAPANGTVLCLNGHSITMNEDATAVITIESGVTFTLYDCSDTGNGKITHGTNGTTGSKYTGRGVSVDGTFNMYGGEITGNTVYKGTTFSAGSGGGVNVNGGTFNMNGGTISNNTADIYGSGVYVDAKGVFNMSGGTITENLRNGGVALSDASTFNMYDTAVISNNEHGADGGGVYVRSSIFNMHGGTIIGNRVTSSANDGGGVALMGTGSIFTMYGGSIVGNETRRSGGGVYVDNQNVFYMQGGTITGNNVNGDSDDSTYKKYYNGGGVFVGGGYKDSSSTYISATFKVSGSARITGNTKGATTKDDKTGCYTGGTSNNVFLLKYNDNAQQATITIADPLTDGASIGVLTGKMPDEDSNVTFATAATRYTLTEEDAGCFTSDAGTGYNVLQKDNTLVLIKGELPHKHPICGVDCSHEKDGSVEHDAQTWKPVSELTDDMAAGYYYLTQNIEISNTWTPADGVYLCLNGYSIRTTQDLNTIEVGSAFTLTDCNGSKGTYHFSDTDGRWLLNATGEQEVTGGVITHGETNSGAAVNVNGGTFTMYGGTICGNSDGNGGGVYVSAGTFNMHGGATTGNKANYGAGVYVDSSGTFTMDGGVISYNTAVSGNGGGVYAAGSFDASGSACITDNTAGNGGGVYAVTGDKVTMTGNVSIADNTAGNGGGVCVNGGKLTVSGSASITGNKATSSGGGISAGDLAVSDSVKITGNTAKLYGGGVDVDNGSFTMSGGSITGNSVTSTRTNFGDGGGVFVYGTNGSFTMTGGEITGNSATNRGGGVLMLNTPMTVSGNVQIRDNWKNGTLSGGVYVKGGDDSSANNLYLRDTENKKRTVTIAADGLSSGASICITTQKTIPESGGSADVAIKNSALTDDDMAAFTSDAGYDKARMGDRVLFVTGSHKHPDCGVTCGHDGTHEDVEWIGVSSVYDIKAAGHYYLTGDADVPSGWMPVDGVVLCLNGHGIVQRQENAAVIFNVRDGVHFILTDCNGSNGSKYFKIDNSDAGRWDYSHEGEEGAFPVSGGHIYRVSNGYNKDSTKGLVYVYSGGTLDMYGGTICGGVAKNDNGGGVYVQAGGKFNMYGGTITGNIAGKKGSGVYVEDGGTFTVGGAANITGNVNDNVFLATDAAITIDKNLTDSARIGVNTKTAPIAGNPVRFATDATGKLDYTTIFTPDVTDRNYAVTKNGTDLFLAVHTHEWTFTADNTTKTITAACACSQNGGSVTLSKPAHAIYGDGEDANATITSTLVSGIQVPTIVYSQNGTTQSAAPNNAGDYTASITLGDATVSVDYTVERAKLTVTANENTITYGDEPADKGVTYLGFVNREDADVLHGELNYSFNYSKYGDVGSYSITPGGLTADNYDIETVPGTLTVARREVALTWNGYENRTYDDGRNVTATAGNLVNGDVIDVTVTGGDATGTGTHTATATGLTGDKAGNYKLPANNTKEYTIGEAAQTLTFEKNDSSLSVVYGDTLANPATNDRADKDGSTVTYTSGDPNVATVDEKGTVTAKNVGTTLITAKAAAVDGKYTEATASYTLTVGKRPITLTIDPITVYYGEDALKTIPTPKIVAGSSLAFQDTIQSLGLSWTTVGTEANVGAYKVNADVPDDSNYELTFNGEDKLIIRPRPITVTPVTGQHKTYGTADHALTYTYSGAVNGETPAFTGALARAEGENAGSYAIGIGTLALKDGSGFMAGNYTLELGSTPVDFTIDKAEPGLPTGLIGVKGRKLSTVVLPAGWHWADGEEMMDETGDRDFPAYYDGDANYLSVTKNLYVTVSDKAIDTATMTVTQTGITFARGTLPEYTLTGKPEETGADTVRYTGTLRKDNSSYDSSEKPTQAGSYTVIVTCETETTIYTASAEFDINPLNLAEYSVYGPKSRYNGMEQRAYPILEGPKGDPTMTEGTDYTRSGDFTATTVGSYTVNFNGIGNYTGTASGVWEITPAPLTISGVTVAPKTYDGSTGASVTEVIFAGLQNGETLAIGTDYEVIGAVFNDANVNEADKVTGTVALKDTGTAKNYTLSSAAFEQTATIRKADAPTLTDISISQKFTVTTGEKTIETAGMPGDAGALTYSKGSESKTGSVTVTSWAVDPTGKVTYKLSGGAADDTVTLPVIITSANYEDTTVKVVITLTARDDQAALTITGGNTVVYGKTLTLGTTGGSGTGKVTYSIDEANSTGEATIDANGVLTPTMVGTVTVKATKAGDADYSEATSAASVITITKAGSTGEPKYTVITADGKTLADAGLTLTGSTLNPTEGTLKWVDEAGNELPADTKVEVNKTYKWCFTPENTNYDILTGEVELWHVDAPAISAQPKNISVITGEKATFEVIATGTDVTYQWQIDRNDGKGFVDINGATGATYTTGVTDKDCDGFKYQCVIRNAADSVTTDTVVLTVKEKNTITATAGEHGSISPNGAVEVVEGSNQTFVITAEEGYEIESLTVDGKSVDVVTSYTFENVTAAHTIAVTFKLQYKILDGANSSWTQNTDESGSIKIRGNGDISKFVNVKVDGVIVDPVNYTVTEGSTIIEFKPEYLKTLSEGSHTFEMFWTDGSASTSFTVAKNTSGSDDPGNKDTGNKDTGSNDPGNSDPDSNNDNSNTAQTLTKSPKTGDASGLWIALFAASAAGLAVMLVRRKKY